MADNNISSSDGKNQSSSRPIGKDGKPLKPCCVCLETKGQRDEW